MTTEERTGTLDVMKLRRELDDTRSQRDSLKEQLEASEDAITQLHSTLAEAGEERKEFELKIAAAEREAARLRAEIEAKTTRLDTLRTDIGKLEDTIKQYKEADPAFLAEREAKAASIRQALKEEQEMDAAIQHKLETKRSWLHRLLFAAIATGLTGLIFVIMYFFDTEKKTSWVLRLGIPGTVFLVALFSNYIKQTAEAAWPHITKQWRPIAGVVSIAVGIVIASISYVQKWMWDFEHVLLYLVVMVGYAGLIYGAVELAHFLVTEVENESDEKKARFRRAILFQAVLSVAGGVVLIIMNPFGLYGRNPAVALLYIALGILVTGLVGLIGILAAWAASILGQKLFANFSHLWRKEVQRKHREDQFYTTAKMIVQGCSVFIAIIITGAIYPSNGNIEMRFVAVGVGIMVAAIFWFVETLALKMAHHAKTLSLRILIIILKLIGIGIASLVVATLSGYITFSTFYSLVVEDEMFAHYQTRLIQSEETYFNQALPYVTQAAERAKTPEERAKYQGSINAMQDSMEATRNAKEFKNLSDSSGVFIKATGAHTQKLPFTFDGKLIEAVRVPPKPSPLEIGAKALDSVFSDHKSEDDSTEIPVFNSGLWLGGAAMVFLDFSAFVMFLIMLIGGIKREASALPEQVGYMQVVSIEGRNEKILVNLGPRDGMQIGTAVQLFRNGGMFAALEVVEYFGNGACVCKPVGESAHADIRPGDEGLVAS